MRNTVGGSTARYLSRSAAVIAAAALLGVCGALAADGRAAQWISTASAGLDPRALDALAQMPDPARRLLALRGYLRAGASFGERWSWSQQKITAYPESPEGQAAAADIEAVRAAFASANPGFTVDANREPRSLELQLSRWNTNPSVSRTAEALVKSMVEKFSARETQPDAATLRAALIDWAPPSAASLAVPGLSAHGQGRAYDFRVMQGERTVAGTEAATARSRWDDAGWTRKLNAAVLAAKVPFNGPLQAPYEPWHYAYSPRAAAPAQ